MTQALTDDLDRDAALGQQRRVCIAQVVQGNPRDPRPLDQIAKRFSEVPGRNWKAIGPCEDQILIMIELAERELLRGLSRPM